MITDDPLHLKWGQKDMYVDLRAKQLLAAEQGTKKIYYKLLISSLIRAKL
ncbi:element excision factor XisH family protein [uncultured Nostoc sp.]